MFIYNKDLSKIAIESSKGTYSYGEFQKDVKLIADFLTFKKVRKIFIITEQNYFFYCILWSAYISGITFCSINSDVPLKMIEKYLSSFKPDIIISEKYKFEIDTILMHDIYLEAQSFKENVEKIIYPQSNNVMYVLFTSGSTGEPKGVTILRNAFEDVINWAQNNLGIVSEDIIGQYCNLGFDMGLCDVFLAISIGAKLIPMTGVSKLIPGQTIKKYRISCLYTVPTIIDIFEKHNDFENNKLSSLRLLGFGGAPLYKRHMTYICKYRPFIKIYNTYGPTETTLFTSCIIFIAMDFKKVTENSVCIGNPIDKVKYEIIHYDDENTGELIIIGSHCLAGYLNDSEKLNFFNAKSKGYFRTGDIIYIKNNNYYFSSRKDNQIKLNGNRINLDGIDARLDVIGIRSISMLIEERLIIFYEGKDKEIQIMKELETYLPRNCLPNDLIKLDNIPLNKNGKYDRLQLLKYYKKIKPYDYKNN